MYMAMKAYAQAVVAEMIAACRDDNRFPIQVNHILGMAMLAVQTGTNNWLEIQDDRYKYLILNRGNPTAFTEEPKREDLQGVYLKNGLVLHWKKVRHDMPLLMRATWEANVDGVVYPITVLFDAECAATIMTRSAANRIGLMP